MTDEKMREALEWALDEIDALSNRLVQWAYPQGMAMLGREDQFEKYKDARAALSTKQEGEEVSRSQTEENAEIVAAEAALLAEFVEGFLVCPEIADCAPEDKDQETHELERRARAILRGDDTKQAADIAAEGQDKPSSVCTPAPPSVRSQEETIKTIKGVLRKDMGLVPGGWDYLAVDIARALSLPAPDGGSAAGEAPIDPWQPMSTAPKDGRTIEARGTMRVHHMRGAKFSVMPKDWRPDTPHAEWRLTEWREFDHAADQQAASVAGTDETAEDDHTPTSELDVADAALRDKADRLKKRERGE